jgi:hypothetical protein
MSTIYRKRINVVIGPTVMINNVPATSGHPECYVEMTAKFKMRVREVFDEPEINARRIAADFEETIGAFLVRAEKR